MKTYSLAVSVALLFVAVAAFAEEAKQKPEKVPATVAATFLVSGLHCQPCIERIESSLKKVEGIRAIKMEWKSKDARIEFDEAVLPVQKVAQMIADTPHMMGGNMHYGGWLVLKVPDVKDDGSAKLAREVLSKVEGVKHVGANSAQHTVVIQFATKGDATTTQLIEALKTAGLTAST